jgi:hypothetical protein
MEIEIGDTERKDVGQGCTVIAAIGLAVLVVVTVIVIAISIHHYATTPLHPCFDNQTGTVYEGHC